MGKLFGTDGVRGVANKELTPELAMWLGKAGAFVLTEGGKKAKVVLGRDTRISGDMLSGALVAGITSVGVDVLDIGVAPTPAVAYLTRILNADAGIVISASHNPVQDNGIKFFAGTGYKLPDEVEDKIEELVLKQDVTFPAPLGKDVGRLIDARSEHEKYIVYAAQTIKTDLKGMKIAVDCANGAASFTTPEVLRRLGAEVIAINASPDGTNINADCGSTHPEMLAEKVLEYKANIGIAHDGDADRMLAIDEQGNIVDGDEIMAICGINLLEKGELPQKKIVATVYSNLGLEKAFQAVGAEVIKTQAGDRYVLEEMVKEGIVLGGEQSGHIIFLNYNTTGDGLITALQLLAAVKEKGKNLSELATVMKKYPQVLLNARVRNKDEVFTSELIQNELKEAEKKLEGRGRIFVRPSGTEPLVRVMAEGPEKEEIESIVQNLVNLIEKELGNG